MTPAPKPSPGPGPYPPPGAGQPIASVRVVNAHAKTPTFDVLVDNEVLLDDLSYSTASGYLDVEAGSRHLGFVSGSGTFDDHQLDLAEGADYTILPCCMQFPNSTVLTDDNSEPAVGNARLRVVDFATLASSVNVYLTAPGADLAGAEPTFVLDIGSASDYMEVPAGNYQMRVTNWDSDTVVIDSGALTLAEGQVRTIVTMDASGGGEPFGLLVLEDLN